jgi:DNA-binding CsgD family transcriptional regulator
MALDTPVLRRLIDGLAELYEPTDTDGYAAQVVAVAMRLLAVDSCSYNEIGAAPGSLAYWVEPPGVGVFPDSTPLFQRHISEHPVLAYNRATGDGHARRISDFLSDRQFFALGLYRDFYRRAEVRYQAAISLPAPGGGMIAVALNRQRRDFHDDELELMDLLRPHIATAASTAVLLSRPLPAVPRTPEGRPVLTPRQTRILELVAAGHSDRGIARLLSISIRTVHAHLQHIYRSLDVTSRTEALAELRALPLVALQAGGRSSAGPGPRRGIIRPPGNGPSPAATEPPGDGPPLAAIELVSSKLGT